MVYLESNKTTTKLKHERIGKIMANNKMTNAKAIGYVLENCVLPEEVFEKIKNIKASLEKKSTGKKKTTKDDLERQEIKETIFDFLSANEGSEFTITEIMHNIEGYNKYSNQKLSALVKQLVANGLVEREEDIKGKAKFSVAMDRVVKVELETEEVAETEPTEEVTEVAEVEETEPTEETAEDTETDFDNPAEDM
jgi:hypothetical protein